MLTWPAPRALLTALSVYLAVMLALYVAFALDLDNPWWAMATAFLAQPRQPFIGAIWAKAFYRIVGTLIGAIASIVIIPNLANAPELMILCAASWVGLCVFGGLLDRTPRFYAFMLSGYTVTLVALPAAGRPEAIFDIVVARSEEILAGVLASALVQSVLFPTSVGTAMIDRLDEVMADTRKWIGELLGGATPVPAPRHLASRLTEINLMATDWRFEASFSRFQRRALWALEERLIALPTLITAAEDRVAALRNAGGAAPELPVPVSRIASWFGTGERENQPVLDEIKAAAPQLGPKSSWADLLVASLTGRLTEIVATWRECVLLADAVRAPTRRAREAVEPLVARARPRTLHVDKGVALLSAIVAALTIMAAAAFTVAIQWQSGVTAIGFASLCCALFATADDPLPQLKDFFIGLAVALPLPLLYGFAILPRIDGFVMLSVALFPIIAVLGLLQTYPRLTWMTLGAVFTFSAGLALEPIFAADLARLMNSYVGFVVGPIFAFVGMGLARVIPAARVIQRILRSGWRELAALAKAEPAPSQLAWTSRMVDRIGLLLARLSQIDATEESELSTVLRDLRLGVGVVELQRLRATVDPNTRREIDAVFAELATHFDALARGKPDEIPTGAVARLDAAMAGILALPDAGDRYAGIGAAIGFRRNLFPNAPAYRAIGVTP